MAILPTNFQAGLTFERRAILTAHPAPDWSVSAYLRGPGAIDLHAAADGAAHVFTATPSVTALWAPGAYWYSVRAASGGALLEIEAGQIVIAPDLAATGAGFDGRDHAERVLSAINAVIENRATLDQQRYTINNRELWRTPIADLLALRDRYRAEIKRNKMQKSGQLFNQNVRVRFRNA